MGTEPHALRGDKGQRMENRFYQKKHSVPQYEKLLYFEGDGYISARCLKITVINNCNNFSKKNKVNMKCDKQILYVGKPSKKKDQVSNKREYKLYRK